MKGLDGLNRTINYIEAFLQAIDCNDGQINSQKLYYAWHAIPNNLRRNLGQHTQQLEKYHQLLLFVSQNIDGVEDMICNNCNKKNCGNCKEFSGFSGELNNKKCQSYIDDQERCLATKQIDFVNCNGNKNGCIYRSQRELHGDETD